MRRVPLSAAARALILLALGAVAFAQQNEPHTGYVYPAGGRQGTVVDVKIGGRFLENVSAVFVSGAGVRGEVVGYDRPLTPQQINELREKTQELQKTGNVVAAREELAALRLRIGDALRRNANPAIAESVTARIAIAADASPGHREVRLATPLGLSNPLVFCVGQLAEFREKDEKSGESDAETSITLPAVVNGRIVPGEADRRAFPLRQPPQYMPGDVDRYRFDARKGQDLVIAVSARDLMPYLADAVPGWFQPILAVFDAAGREVAYDDDYRFQPDPVIHYRVPADGTYVVEIKDALYRGREDFVYRIAIGELPFVTSCFPMGGRAGTRTPVHLEGWNLPSTKMTIDGRRLEPGRYTVPAGSDFASGPVLFAIDTLSETFEREPNGSPRQAQPLTLPTIVNGRIQVPGDRDMFSFSGRAGEEVVAEVEARRLGSPLDSVLELYDAAGHRVAYNDDHPDRGAGLVTHQADSFLLARLPATGIYVLRLSDIQGKGGVEYTYRLRVGPPRPDFELRVSPSAINAAGSGTVAIVVDAIRKDGFAGEIQLALAGAPPGFRLSGAAVPPGEDRIRLTLTVPSLDRAARTDSPAPVNLVVEGRAVIGGRTIVHRAVPADDMMQAFAYHHLVTADDLCVSVVARGATRVASSILTPQPVQLPAGGSVRVRAALPPGYLTFEKIEFELSDPPAGIALRDLVVTREGAEFVLQADATKVKPGSRGNVILTVSGERAPRGDQAAAPPARRRVPLGTLPAVAFEIVAPSSRDSSEVVPGLTVPSTRPPR